MTGVSNGVRADVDFFDSAARTGPEELSQLPPHVSPWFTVIIPTRDNESTVGPLLSRLAAAVGNAVVEVLFVDDSRDGTLRAIRNAAYSSGFAVRLLHRFSDHRFPEHRDSNHRTPDLRTPDHRGGAVVEGLRWARGPWAVVLDGDLQHPPEIVASLVAIGVTSELDLVAGSRYTGAGTAKGPDGGHRQTASGSATVTTKTMFPRRVARLSDPMSGFFAVRLAALDIDRLHPNGKVLKEIAAQQPRLRMAEVRFAPGRRIGGDRPASREGQGIARQIARFWLEVGRWPRAARHSSSARPVKCES